MTRDEAHASLASAEMEERLKAARFFALHAVSADRRKLRAALRKETVPWVKRALERSLNKAGPVPMQEATGSELSARLLAELRSKAIDEVASTIVHELSTTIGRLRLTVPTELQQYDTSKTKALIDSLAMLLNGIRNLKTAVGRADYVECDLSAWCRETCQDFENAAGMIHLAGTAPFMVEIDPGLFKLAFANVVRNAVEAVLALPEGSERSITVNWGWAGHEFWLAVLDSGPGFEREPSSLVKLGETTKADHIGFGLATAKQAMQAMEGDIYPSNTAEGGARVELRWFGSHEDIVR